MTSATSTLAPRRRIAALLTALGLTAAACGGGSDDAAPATDDITNVTEPAPAEVGPADTEPVATQAPATDPPVTEPVATEPPVTETPIGTDSTGTTVTQESCDAILDLFTPGRALRFFDTNDGTGVEASFTALTERVQPVRDTATTSDIDSAARRVGEAIDEIIPLLDEIDFIVTDASTSSLSDEARFNELGETIAEGADEFETYLLDNCGVTEDLLNDVGFDFARSVAVLPVTDGTPPPADEPEPPSDPDPGPASGQSMQISDDSGRLNVAVPAEWSDVSGTPGANEDRLIASVDQQGFLDGFAVPGMFIEGIDVAAGEGTAAFPGGVEAITASYEAGGCVVRSFDDYSDALYTGTETILDCVPGFELRLIGGTNSEADRIFALVMVIERDDLTTRDLLADTFTVD